MPKIKIIELFQSYSEFYQPYIPPVIEALKKRKEIEIQVHAFNGDKNGEVQIIPSYKKRKLKEKYYNLKSLKSPKLNFLEITAIQNKVDIVHIQHSFLFPKTLGLLKLQAEQRPKIIITLRGGDTYVKPWYYNNWTQFYKNYGSLVDAFITVSEHQKKYLHEKWHIEKNRIHAIPVSVNNTFEIQPKYPNIDTLKIVSAFRMTWEKNIEGSIQFAKSLKDKNIPFVYDIFGDGNDLGQLYYLVDKYQLHNYVNIKGKIDNDGLLLQLPKYDFFVQLSISEALSVSVLEAQSVGLPCVVSNSDGLVEAVIRNKTAIVEDYLEIDKLVNSCIELWKNKDEYHNFSKNAINFVKSNFTVEHEVDKMVKLYQSLIK